VSLKVYAQAKAAGQQPEHHSCWGDWHLAVLKGSENKALAVDLINNLMSTRKVSERAFSGAGLPTVTRFYESYGEARCFDFVQRPDVRMPATTFGGLRRMLFTTARSRVNIFDYPHCARVLHGLLQWVHGTQEMRTDELQRKVEASLEQIHQLRDSDPDAR
jgi:hypothetical protein